MIELLLQHDADVEAVDARGKTPLYIACAERRWSDAKEAVRLLIKYGANVNRRTPLHRAVLEVSTRMIPLLLRHGSDVDAVDERGNSAMYHCLNDHLKYTMECLLNNGADPNAVDNDGNSLLHRVCRDGWKAGAELLLKHGANLEMENSAGLTATQVATKGGRRDVLKLIRKWDTKAVEFSDRPRASDEPHGKKLVMIEEEDDEHVSPNVATPGESPNPADNVWAGVRRDNGDGFILAQYNNHDVSFDAKLESISPRVHQGKDMHELQIKLNFMRPYSLDYRIRYANIDVMLDPGAEGSAPNICHIMPQADRVEVSEQEITSGKTFTVGATGGGGPQNVNISMEGSKSKRATFKGVRIIHGAVKDRMHASWRLYEEPGSRSGLPEIVRILLHIHCEEEFGVRLALSIKASHFLTFGIPRTLSAPAGPVYMVPKLNTITAYQEESRLRRMLDVADRAALLIESSTKLEDRFTRAMRNHAKRHLIIQAGTKENHLQEWTDILDDSEISDFRTLREKLLEIDEKEGGIQRSRRRTIEDSVSSPYSEPDSHSDFRGLRSTRRRLLRRSSYQPEYSYEQGEEYTISSRKPLHNFSPVGPAYHVSHLS
ncbi:hypothetical protein BDW69DRAFT_198216 [Aspergillus filifer]